MTGRGGRNQSVSDCDVTWEKLLIDWSFCHEVWTEIQVPKGKKPKVNRGDYMCGLCAVDNVAKLTSKVNDFSKLLQTERDERILLKAELAECEKRAAGLETSFQDRLSTCESLNEVLDNSVIKKNDKLWTEVVSRKSMVSKLEEDVEKLKTKQSVPKPDDVEKLIKINERRKRSVIIRGLHESTGSDEATKAKEDVEFMKPLMPSNQPFRAARIGEPKSDGQPRLLALTFQYPGAAEEILRKRWFTYNDRKYYYDRDLSKFD